MQRRTLLATALLAAPARAQGDTGQARLDALAGALERRIGGRLGVAVLDTARAQPLAHRGAERFPLCSTYKYLAAAFVLARVDQGAERLDRRVRYGVADLLPYAPVTTPHVGADGLTVGELCAAAVSLSDNTAGNLLLDSFGGAAALTAWLRTLGDAATRLDRREPDLNEALAGDPRDTTTPLAMLHTLRVTLLGAALSGPSRTQLAAWLVACSTGAHRLRAGAPAGWRTGDRTGSGNNAATNDIAVFWPPGRAPILVTAYAIGGGGTEAERSAGLAEIGRYAASV